MTYEREKDIKELTSNEEYIKWLNEFSKDHKGFMSDDWQFSSDKISKLDQKNVLRTFILFEAIKKYATENFIYPNTYSCGVLYRIKFNNVGYEVGTFEGYETLYYVNRVELEYEKFYIDFKDIINNVKQPHTDEMNSKLNDIKERIEYLYKNGVPIEKIERYLKGILHDTEKKLILK